MQRYALVTIPLEQLYSKRGRACSNEQHTIMRLQGNEIRKQGRHSVVKAEQPFPHIQVNANPAFIDVRIADIIGVDYVIVTGRLWHRLQISLFGLSSLHPRRWYKL